MSKEQTIESIVQELLRHYQIAVKPPTRILYVLDDSSLAGSFSDHWIELHNHGLAYDILALDSEAAGWLSSHYVECTRTGGRCITIDDAAPAPMELPSSYDAIVVPDIDLDTAYRVLHGLKGSVKSELIYSALVQHKWILMAEDCSGITRSDRRTLQTLTLPAAYQRKYELALQQLQEYGIELSETKLLAKRIIAHFLPSNETVSHSLVQTEARSTSKLLNAARVREWFQASHHSSNTLTIAQGTIVTALAADFIRDNSIALLVEE